MTLVLSFTKKRVVDENKLAQNVAIAEGGTVSLTIAQVKEVQRLLLENLATEWSHNPHGVIALIKKHAILPKEW